jgi:hypothetical protein
MNKLSLLIVSLFIANSSCKAQEKTIENFLPQGYIVYKKHFGDLNNDGAEDCILIIKGTNKEHIVVNRFDEKVDRNRRGIIVLLKKGKGYEMVVANESCFYSENEDGGIYYAPQLSIEIEKGDVLINYEHGRYGSWYYTFRLQNFSLNLIAYNSEDLYSNTATYINFLTKKKVVEDYEEEDQNIFIKESSKNISIDKLINLSEINDFEELDMSKY